MATNNQILKFPQDLEKFDNFSFISFSAYNKVSEKSPDKVAPSNGTSSPQKAKTETKFDNPHTVYMFVPGTLTDNQSISYEDADLRMGKQFADTSGTFAEYSSRIWDRMKSQAGQNVLGAIEGVTGIKAKSAWEFGNKKVLNPQMEVLFRNVGFREFTFTFDMFPKNEKESQEIERIIRVFKYYSHPYINGNYIHYPAWFQIEAKTGGSNKRTLKKFHRAVITNVNVEQNPTGTWSTFANGDPINTKLTLTIKEIKQVMRDDIKLNINEESF